MYCIVETKFKKLILRKKESRAKQSKEIHVPRFSFFAKELLGQETTLFLELCVLLAHIK